MFRKGKSLIAVDPSQGDKADFLSVCHRHAPDKPIETPIRLHLTFSFSRPKNHYRANGEVKPNAPHYHISKPDVDNLIKFIADSLNGVFFRDDSLICEISAKKVYGEAPGTYIGIEWGEQLDALRKVV
jgi:Holliday junction resolvase RusA-like endonuclease